MSMNVLDGLNAQPTSPAANFSQNPQVLLNQQNAGFSKNTLTPPKWPKPLADLAEGKVPGIYFPADFDPSSLPPDVAAITPEETIAAGVRMYHPKKDKSVAIVFARPEKLSLSQLRAADEAGQLKTMLTPITQYSSTQPAEVLSGLSAANSKPDSSQPVPVLPPPAFGPAAQRTTAANRAQGADPTQPPSQRPLPGQGALLNGLVGRPI